MCVYKYVRVYVCVYVRVCGNKVVFVVRYRARCMIKELKFVFIYYYYFLKGSAGKNPM